MKIAVDLTFVRPDHSNGGTESCIKNLMSGILKNHRGHEFLFLIHEDIYKDYIKLYPTAQFYVYHIKGKHSVRMILFQTLCLPKIIKKQNIDLIYFPTFQTGLRKNIKVPVVVNPHDIQYKFYPNYFSRMKICYFNLFYKRAFQKANGIIAISTYVNETLIKHFPNETKNKTKVLYDPLDSNRIKPDKNSNTIKNNEKYILCINSLIRHKNLITLLQAYNQLPMTLKQEYKLVIGGAECNGVNELTQYINKENLTEYVILTGFLTEGQLGYLYKHARLFVTPSLYEGFGMTPLEAMMSLCPVISSKETSLPEVTQGLVRYYEPATDVTALSKAIIEELNCEPNKEILLRNQKATKRFEVDRITKDYLEYFERIYKEWKSKQK